MNDKAIRVLLLEDDPGDARLLQMMLTQGGPGQFEVTRAERLDEALRLLAQNSTDIILCDLLVPDSRGLGTFGQLYAQAPHVPVVVMSGLADETVAVEAVQQGAQDYLIKGQVNATGLVRALRYAMERHRKLADQTKRDRDTPARVIAFIGSKGGVGTSTVALNVAAALAQQKKRVILAELRPNFGTLGCLLGQAPPENLRTVLDHGSAGLQERRLASWLFNGPNGLQVLFGPQKPNEFQDIEAEQADALVDKLTGMADFTLIDLPSQPSAATQAVMHHCDYVAMIMEREPASVACARTLLDVFKSWGMDGNRVGAVIVNRVVIAIPMELGEIRTRLGCEIVGVIPPAVDACLHAQKNSVPLVMFQPDHFAAAALVETAGRLGARQVTSFLRFE
jgi:Flp pilus assembly CpaE family ATPase